MTFCGFNNQIDNGIRLLIAGMEEAIERRAVDSSRTIRNAVLDEIAELHFLDEKFLMDHKHPYFLMFRALNLFATTYFELVLKGIDARGDFRAVSRAIADRFVQGLVAIDAKHELFRDDSDQPLQSIATLVRWMESVNQPDDLFALPYPAHTRSQN